MRKILGPFICHTNRSTSFYALSPVWKFLFRHMALSRADSELSPGPGGPCCGDSWLTRQGELPAALLLTCDCVGRGGGVECDCRGSNAAPVLRAASAPALIGRSRRHRWKAAEWSQSIWLLGDVTSSPRRTVTPAAAASSTRSKQSVVLLITHC